MQPLTHGLHAIICALVLAMVELQALPEVMVRFLNSRAEDLPVEEPQVCADMWGGLFSCWG
jgi:hypothetical protein